MVYIPAIPQRYGDVLHYMAGYHPALFYPLARRRRAKTSGIFTGADCDIVIEGYPRVGATYAVEAFHHAQPRPVRIASHVHVPAQIMRGVGLGLPILVLIREPEATVRSLVVKHPFLRLRDALRGYALFYRWLRPLARHVVVADFAEVTTRLDAVIERVNAQFDTAFAPFDHSAAAEAAVAERLRAVDAAAGQGARESAEPNREKERAKADLDFSGHERRLTRCRAVYARFRAAAGHARDGEPAPAAH